MNDAPDSSGSYRCAKQPRIASQHIAQRRLNLNNMVCGGSAGAHRHRATAPRALSATLPRAALRRVKQTRQRAGTRWQRGAA